jgi:hypothetical protein
LSLVVALDLRATQVPVIHEGKMFIEELWVQPKSLLESVVQPSVRRIPNVLQEIYSCVHAEHGLEMFTMAGVYPTRGQMLQEDSRSSGKPPHIFA